MPSPAEKSRVVHFGLFEVDLHEQELRKSGIRIKLQEQPFQILALLLEHPGQTVTREELRQKLWPIDTFVDFDHGLNSSVKKLRLALGDDSGNPRFIETLHRRGYRFIAPVDGIPPAAIDPAQRIAIPASTEATPSAAQFSSPTAVAAPKRRSWGLVAGAIAAMILVGGAGFGVYWRFARPAPRPFQNFVVTQVTNSGKVKSAAISPDGRYVASVIDDKGMQSLWLRNLPTGSNTQIIPASSSLYGILRFSPDGNYIYFLRSQNQYWNGYDLYRCPVLGGAPQKLSGTSITLPSLGTASASHTLV